SSRRRHTRSKRDWSSDVCSSDLLQHGIIGVRDLRYMYGRKKHERFTDLFVVSSSREKKIITNNYGFSPNEVILTGLPRFDLLIEESKNNKLIINQKKKVLIMPTWRP